MPIIYTQCQHRVAIMVVWPLRSETELILTGKLKKTREPYSAHVCDSCSLDPRPNYSVATRLGSRELELQHRRCTSQTESTLSSRCWDLALWDSCSGRCDGTWRYCQRGSIKTCWQASHLVLGDLDVQLWILYLKYFSLKVSKFYN